MVAPRAGRLAPALRTAIGAGIPKPVGCAIGGLVITVYFAAGGLLTSAWVLGKAGGDRLPLDTCG